jgi:hypothetical protein
MTSRRFEFRGSDLPEDSAAALVLLEHPSTPRPVEGAL